MTACKHASVLVHQLAGQAGAWRRTLLSLGAAGAAATLEQAAGLVPV